ncbi:MAG: hypothetical protein LBR91_00195 [Puniceicoccales bacterium]|jgi:hypothetical protein|nr:hypothetical protein [Puniceicoccales bacterium]
MNRRTNTNRGMSLLEVVLSITLLIAIVPPLFGIFFANANLAKKLSVDMKLGDVADDVKSFVKLSTYDRIYNLAKRNAVLAVEEEDEADGICARKFVEKEPDIISGFDFVAKLEFANCNGTSGTAHIDSVCAMPLLCRIYHISGTSRRITGADLPTMADATRSMFVVKMR